MESLIFPFCLFLYRMIDNNGDLFFWFEEINIILMVQCCVNSADRFNSVQ